MSSSLRIIDYLETLPGVTKNQLYKQPSTVLAVFRRIQSHLGMRQVLIRSVGVTDKCSEKSGYGSAVHGQAHPSDRLGFMGATGLSQVRQTAFGI